MVGLLVCGIMWMMFIGGVGCMEVCVVRMEGELECSMEICVRVLEGYVCLLCI